MGRSGGGDPPFPPWQLLYPALTPRAAMAKSEPFVIRSKVTSNGNTYAQEEIDLGSFVNLGVKSSTLLRIHQVFASIRDTDFPGSISVDDAQACIAWQLTTQSQTAIVDYDDKSLIAAGHMQLYPGEQASGDYKTSFATQDFDLNPSDFDKGMLIGVDTLFLSVDQSVVLTSGNVDVGIQLVCTLENATQASATALALSQQ